MATIARTLWPQDLAPTDENHDPELLPLGQMFAKLDSEQVDFRVKHGLYLEEVTGYSCSVAIFEDGSTMTWDHEADGEPHVYQGDIQWPDGYDESLHKRVVYTND